MEKKRPKRRLLYLHRSNSGHYSARIGYGPPTADPDMDHWYQPTEASARRLAKVMERVLDSKQFWWTRVTPRSLMIRLERIEVLEP